MNKKQRIFISYSYNDKNVANKITDKLLSEGIEVVSGIDQIQTGHSYLEEIKYLYETSEIIIVLLSESLFRNDKFQFEFPRFFFDEARKRKVTIIPALVEKCSIPSDFLEFDIINLTTNFDKGLEKIIQKIKVIPEISFENFHPRNLKRLFMTYYENMVLRTFKRKQYRTTKELTLLENIIHPIHLE